MLRSFAPFLSCLILISTLLFLSSPIESGHYEVEHQNASSTSPFRSFFSLHGPGSSLFAPAAVISLTDDNSTFFNARPAAFGPQLPLHGLSGPVWAGHTFPDEEFLHDGLISADSGELGCDDIPGWHSRWWLSQPHPRPPQQAHSDTRRTESRDQDDLESPNPQELNPQRLRNTSFEQVNGKIVLLSRGGCGFLEKVLWAQRRGATAVVVGDKLNGGPLVTMYAKGDTSNVSIPSVFTSHMTAHLLASLVPQGADLTYKLPLHLEAVHAQEMTEQRSYHEGLWVTLSLASSGAGPFFNTLFVLVVSPLITLAIVYVMLLVRARIRRRRWRAPKSVVDRLPVRVYRAISSRASPRMSTDHGAPTSPSPTTPLLTTSRRGSDLTTSNTDATPSSSYGSCTPSERIQEKPTQDIPIPNAEQKRYNQKQVECAVCLEEYEDGISRVMSLPCGHDFHADCVTPWLTTKRRTCPICKGDVVRSLGGESSLSARVNGASEADEEEELQREVAEARNDEPASHMPLILRREDVEDLGSGRPGS